MIILLLLKAHVFGTSRMVVACKLTTMPGPAYPTLQFWLGGGRFVSLWTSEWAEFPVLGKVESKGTYLRRLFPQKKRLPPAHLQIVIYLASETPSQQFMNFIDDQEVRAISCSPSAISPSHASLWPEIELVQLGMEGAKPAITTKPISEEGILRVGMTFVRWLCSL